MKLIKCPDSVLEEMEKHSPLLVSSYFLKKKFSKEFGPLVFLGGGITSCPIWQDTMIDHLKDSKCVLINPRRKNWDIKNTNKSQIEWEHLHLSLADKIVFWFPHETLCPITLFELGKYLKSDKELFIGCHPKYQKKEDVEIQVKLERPNIKIYDSLENLAKEIKNVL